MVLTVHASSCDVTHPLYGYKTDIKNALPERVPGWAFVPGPRCGDDFRKDDTADYLQAGIEEYTSAPIPDGERFKLDTVGTGFGKRDDKPDSIAVRFRVDPDATHMTRGGSQYHMPSDMRERIDAMKQSYTFDRKFDGHHVRFRGWRFDVTVGRRGGIRDVDLYAWGKN